MSRYAEIVGLISAPELPGKLLARSIVITHSKQKSLKARNPMFRKEIVNRFGEGILRKCRGCQHYFGVYCDLIGRDREFFLYDYEMSFGIHELSCLNEKVWRAINIKQVVYEKND